MAAASLAAVIDLGQGGVAQAMPFVPTGDAVILELVPESLDPAGATLHGLATRLAASPHDLALATQVARLDIRLSRSLGDPRFLGRAEAAMAPWPIDAGTPPEILLLRAVVMQSNHDFPGSIAALQRVVGVPATSSQAWITLAAVQGVQADYRAALHDCGQLATAVIGLAPDICTASIMSMTGHAALALRATDISLAVNEVEAARAPALRDWALTVAAETAERLDDPTTEARYRAALAASPTDPYLLGAFCDWLLDHGRAREVMTLLAPYDRIDPLLLRTALAEQALGDPHLAVDVDDLGTRFETSRLRGETIHRREEARFVLHLRHDVPGALALAKANWSVQREPADARILLDAAIAANDPAGIDTIRAWRHKNAVEDRSLDRVATPAASVTRKVQGS